MSHYECRDCGHPNGVSAAHCSACKADALARIEAFGRDPQGLDGEATKAGIAPNISGIANHREGV